MDLPSTLDSMSISEIPSDLVVEKLQSYSRTCYQIQASGDDFYVIAGEVKVFKNLLELSETSLGVLEYKGRDEEVMLQADNH